jgi:hypothetical protein
MSRLEIDNRKKMKNQMDLSIDLIFLSTDLCYLSNNIYDYYNVSQGKITVPGIDDGEEMMAADVSLQDLSVFFVKCFMKFNTKILVCFYFQENSCTKIKSSQIFHRSG